MEAVTLVLIVFVIAVASALSIAVLVRQFRQMPQELSFSDLLDVAEAPSKQSQ